MMYRCSSVVDGLHTTQSYASTLSKIPCPTKAPDDLNRLSTQNWIPCADTTRTWKLAVLPLFQRAPSWFTHTPLPVTKETHLGARYVVPPNITGQLAPVEGVIRSRDDHPDNILQVTFKFPLECTLTSTIDISLGIFYDPRLLSNHNYWMLTLEMDAHDALANSVLLNKKPKHPHDSDTLASESSSSTASTPIEEIVCALLSSKYFFHSPTSILLDRKNEQRQQPETHGKNKRKTRSSKDKITVNATSVNVDHDVGVNNRPGKDKDKATKWHRWRWGHYDKEKNDAYYTAYIFNTRLCCDLTPSCQSEQRMRCGTWLELLGYGITGQPHCDANDEEFDRCKQKYSHMEATYK